VTEMAVMQPTENGLVLKELAPGVDLETLQGVTGTRLIVPDHVPTMNV